MTANDHRGHRRFALMALTVVEVSRVSETRSMSSTRSQVRRLIILPALIALVVSGVPSVLRAQDAALTPVRVFPFTAVGGAIYSPTPNCTGIECPDGDTCTADFTLNGNLNSFNRFGPNMLDPSFTICMSVDTTIPVRNGNVASYCYPSSGIATLNESRTKKTITMSIAGWVCSMPNGPSTNLSTVSGAFALTNSTLSVVSTASGAFSAYYNTNTPNAASCTFTGNFSK